MLKQPTDQEFEIIIIAPASPSEKAIFTESCARGCSGQIKHTCAWACSSSSLNSDELGHFVAHVAI